LIPFGKIFLNKSLNINILNNNRMKPFCTLAMLFFTHQMLSAQVDTCLCQRLIGECKDNFETVTEMVMVKPECKGQKVAYQQITKKVLKYPCEKRIEEYPCDCKEKAKRHEAREEDIPAEYITVKKYDCDGNPKTEIVMVKAASKRIIYEYPPELVVKRN
jgi:hypothetical protein